MFQTRKEAKNPKGLVKRAFLYAKETVEAKLEMPVTRASAVTGGGVSCQCPGPGSNNHSERHASKYSGVCNYFFNIPCRNVSLI